MEYFILAQKENIPNTVILHILPDNSIERKQVIGKEQAQDVNDVSNIFVTSSPDNFYPDIIDAPIFLVSDKVKRLVKNYDDSPINKCVVLTDSPLKKQSVYWLMLMDQIDCLSDDSEYYEDGSIKKLVLDKRKIGNKKIFRINGIREKIVIINLDIAESLLRRFLSGIDLKKVECI